MGKCYITDLRHCLNKNGDIPENIPIPAYDMSIFMVSIVEKVTAAFPFVKANIKTGIQCRTKTCRGDIIGALDGLTDPVLWGCEKCGDNGMISDWQGSKWDRTNKVVKNNS